MSEHEDSLESNLRDSEQYLQRREVYAKATRELRAAFLKGEIYNEYPPELIGELATDSEELQEGDESGGVQPSDVP